MVDFSFIVSLYVSDLPNVTISTMIRTARTIPSTIPIPGPKDLLFIIFNFKNY